MSTFRMPSLGSDMERATLIEWLVEAGADVSRGDVIAVVETDKGAIEIEVFERGRIAALLVEIGTEVEVGAPLAEIETDAGSRVADAPGPGVQPSATPPGVPHGESSGERFPDSATERPTAPRAPSARSAQIPAPVGRRISPAARRLAQAENVDIGRVQGTGPEGAIVVADIERALEEAPRPAAARGPSADMQGMRRAIGAAMARSKREIPHYYLAHTADLGALSAWLEQTNAERPPKDRLLAGALFVKATALALPGFPEFNGFFEDGVYRASEQVNVGTAIAIRGGGLVAPAVHGTDRLSLDELMARLRDLTGRVRAGRFRGSELRDPTITVSSLGERGVDEVYGVIYPPQVACIGFGKVALRPWVADDMSVVARPTVTITLSADHRVSDGRRGALLLATITELLQSPDGL